MATATVTKLEIAIGHALVEEYGASASYADRYISDIGDAVAKPGDIVENVAQVFGSRKPYKTVKATKIHARSAAELFVAKLSE